MQRTVDKKTKLFIHIQKKVNNVLKAQSCILKSQLHSSKMPG